MKKKIVFFLSSFNRGGAEWVITNLANSMCKNSIEVTLYTVRNGEMLEELLPEIESRHFNGSYRSAVFALIKILQKKRHSVLFTTQRAASILGYFAKTFSFSKNQHIVREAASNFNSLLISKPFFSKPLWKIAFSIAYGNAYKIIVNSAGTKKSLEQAGIIKLNKTNVFQIDNPLDIKTVRARAEQNEFHGLSMNQTSIVSIGRLVSNKNMNLLIKAYQQIQGAIPASQLIIIGEGPEKERLEKLSFTLNIDHKIFFTGKIANPYSILKHADLFVLASKWEGFGQVITEALALGIPVVSTNTQDGPAHILNNGEYGILVKVDSVDDLAAGMLKGLNMTHDIEKLKRRAEMFDKELISRKYEKTIFG